MSDKKKTKTSNIVRVTCIGATEAKLDELEVIQGNLKDLTVTGYESLKASIIAEGFCEPFTVWKRPKDGRLCIVSGTQRYHTLKTMMEEGFQIPLLPVSVIEAKTEKEALRKALSLAAQHGTITSDGIHEIIHRIGGDPEKLLKQFHHQAIDNEALLDNFFRDNPPADPAALASGTPAIEVGSGLVDADQIPDQKLDVKVKPGDIWILGDHRLLCGDSTNADDVNRLMAGQKASVWSSDPPYGINHVAVSQEKGQSEGYTPIQNDELQDEALREFIYKSIMTVMPHMKKGFAFYMWHAMKMQAYFSQAAAAAAAAGILFHRQIIWVKPQFVFGRGHYHWRHELCLMGWLTGDEPEFYGERNQSTVWEVARENDKIHPTQKPVDLFVTPIRNHMKPGEIVYEPFAGSGTNFIAAEKCGVSCYGIEIEPKYCQVIIDRWEQFTGRKAELQKKTIRRSAKK